MSRLIEDATFIQVEDTTYTNFGLYMDGKLFRQWSTGPDHPYVEPWDTPTGILEDLGIDVYRRVTTVEVHVPDFPLNFSELALSQETCKGCGEYVCRTCP